MAVFSVVQAILVLSTLFGLDASADPPPRFDSDLNPLFAPIVVSAAVWVSVLNAQWAARSEYRPWAALWRLVALAIPLGVLGVLIAAVRIRDFYPDHSVGIFPGLDVGEILVALVGSLLAQAPLQACLIQVTRRARSRSTHDATDGSMLSVAASLLALPLLFLLLSLSFAPLLGHESVAAAYVGAARHPGRRELTGAAWLLELGIVALVLAAYRRRWHRRRWLAEVRRGDHPGWRLEPAPADAEAATSELPTLAPSTLPTGELLFRVEDGSAAAYRSVERRPLPVARLAPTSSINS